MKPDFQTAATELKGKRFLQGISKDLKHVFLEGKAVLAAMDVNKPENSPVSRKYNITGFPTLLFFDGGELQYPYPGGNNKEVRRHKMLSQYNHLNVLNFRRSKSSLLIPSLRQMRSPRR